MNILVIDFETTGVDPDTHGVLSAGWVLLGDNLEQIRYGETLVQPREDAVINDKAMEINGLDLEVCGKRGVSEQELLDIIKHQTEDADKTIWAGQNAKFDWGFYQAMLKRHDVLQPSGFDYHILDSYAMCAPLVWDGSMASTSKKSKLEKLTGDAGPTGVLLRTPHQALADAMATAEVIRRTFLGLWGPNIDPYHIGKSNGKDENKEEVEVLKDESGRAIPRHE